MRNNSANCVPISQDKIHCCTTNKDYNSASTERTKKKKKDFMFYSSSILWCLTINIKYTKQHPPIHIRITTYWLESWRQVYYNYLFYSCVQRRKVQLWLMCWNYSHTLHFSQQNAFLVSKKTSKLLMLWLLHNEQRQWKTAGVTGRWKSCLVLVNVGYQLNQELSLHLLL